MRFPTTFIRYQGTAPAGGIALGSESDPDGPETNATNLLEAAQRLDRTINRLAIGYHFEGSDPAAELTCDVWQYANDTGYWYKLTSTPFTLYPDVMNYVGVVGGQPPTANADASLSFFVQVYDSGSPPDGTYTFQVSGDSGVGDPLFGS